MTLSLRDAPRRTRGSAVVAALVLALGLSALTEPVSAQEPGTGDLLEHYLWRRTVRCVDLTSNLIGHVPRLLALDRPDSAAVLTHAWRARCPDSRLALVSDVLVRMQAGEFYEGDYGPELFWLMASETWWQRHGRERARNAVRYQVEVDPSIPAEELLAYANQLDELAVRTADSQPEGSLAASIAAHLAGREPRFFDLLLDSRFAGTQLADFYRERLAEWSVPHYLIYGVFADAWVPYGDLDRVGARAPIGMCTGLRDGDWLSRLALSIAIGGLGRETTIDRDGRLTEAKAFTLMRLGLEFGRALVDERAARVDLLGGVGYSFARWNRPGNSGEDPEFLGTPDLGLGMGLRRPIGARKDGTIGLEVWQRWLFFDAGDRGDSLDGAALVVRLVVTWSPRNAGGQALETLGLDRFEARSR